MKQGELILRDAGKDELYWIVLILLAGLAWTKTEGLLPEQTRLWLTAGVAAAMVILRLTALRRWHIRRESWTLQNGVLQVGSKAIPLADIRSAGLKPGVLTKGSWTLIVRADRTHRFASLTSGAEKASSVQGIQDLGYAIKAAVDEMDGKHA